MLGGPQNHIQSWNQQFVENQIVIFYLFQLLGTHLSKEKLLLNDIPFPTKKKKIIYIYIYIEYMSTLSSNYIL
jgi:hypothetical protein